MNQDHLGNELYVRAVNKFNRVSLPVQIADYLRAKEDMILGADKPSSRDNLCIFLAPKDRGFLVNHFSSHVGLALNFGWGVNRKMFGYPTKKSRAQHFVLSYCDDAEFKNDDIQLPNVFMRFSGISEYVKGETREVVVRRFEHGHPGEIGFVQIMAKDTWNKRFPDNAL